MRVDDGKFSFVTLNVNGGDSKIRQKEKIKNDIYLSSLVLFIEPYETKIMQPPKAYLSPDLVVKNTSWFNLSRSKRRASLHCFSGTGNASFETISPILAKVKVFRLGLLYGVVFPITLCHLE